ncbi:MAG TPA: Na-translocating system protein MpsC family protein [Thermoleophilaceae bacterium]|nr:Na-translocating system protein MpsC family protein [Thermoleophilaceae bacterium]
MTTIEDRPRHESRALSDAQAADPSGDVRTAISDGIVALLKEFYGRGPDKTKTYVNGDLVVCLLRGGFTRVEQTLREGGHGDDVIRQRMAFQDVMRDRFTKVVEDATGRSVIGFMSGNQQDPDMICEIFVLAQNSLLD